MGQTLPAGVPVAMVGAHQSEGLACPRCPLLQQVPGLSLRRLLVGVLQRSALRGGGGRTFPLYMAVSAAAASVAVVSGVRGAASSLSSVTSTLPELAGAPCPVRCGPQAWPGAPAEVACGCDMPVGSFKTVVLAECCAATGSVATACTATVGQIIERPCHASMCCIRPAMQCDDGCCLEPILSATGMSRARGQKRGESGGEGGNAG